MGIIGRIKRRISDHKHGPMYVKDFPIPYLKPKGKIYPLSTKKAKSPEGIPVNREFKFLRFEEHIPSDCEVYGFSAPYYLKSKPSDVKLGKSLLIRMKNYTLK